MYTIKHLSQQFKLSRSTLLYYDNIGLLMPSKRSKSNYRIYSEEDREKLRKICTLREAGISLNEMKDVLMTDTKENEVLTKKLQELNCQVRNLRLQQKLITEMLKVRNNTEVKMLLDKEAFIKVLYSMGFDDEQLNNFHKEFEKNDPDSHQFFLEFLGMEEADIQLLKKSI